MYDTNFYVPFKWDFSHDQKRKINFSIWIFNQYTNIQSATLKIAAAAIS